ncbi:MAG: hypothetical protein QOK02_5907 [Mycobacterium sp.]|jgi:hypothetical protein|nr:hypothetical protein [Mycobacterium sp.]
MHRPADWAVGGRGVQGEHRIGSLDRPPDVAERDGARVAGERPATVRAGTGRDDPGAPQLDSAT